MTKKNPTGFKNLSGFLFGTIYTDTRFNGLKSFAKIGLVRLGLSHYELEP